jgi:hypothetical protein
MYGFYELTVVLGLVAIIMYLIKINQSLKFIEDILSKEHAMMVGEDEEVLSSYEIERQERERIFDERIRELQIELDMMYGEGTPGEILEEGIYNIPHQEVIINKYEDEEVAN